MKTRRGCQISDFDETYFAIRTGNADQRRRQHQLDYSWVETFIKNNSTISPEVSNWNILDVGCSSGQFSQLFNSLGNVYGVEVNPIERQNGKEILHEVSSELPKNTFFQLILIRGTLQHLPNSQEFFKFVESNLVSGGILAVLANPNARGPIYRRTHNLPALGFNKNFSSNFEVFSIKSLEERLSNIDFSQINTQFPYLHTPYAQPWVDIPVGVLSLLTGKNYGRPFPRNMFNWIGSRT